MKSKALISFLLILLSTSGRLPAQGSSPLVHYSEPEGLPQSKVYAIFQDSKGLMWVATQNGAAKFGGYTFKQRTNP